MARPTGFKPEYCKQAKKLCLLGARDVELADFFGVTHPTINSWKKRHPEFFTSIKEGKLGADATVSKSLFQRAKGYSHPEDKIFQGTAEAGPVVVPTTKHYAPDTTACIFWLKNRRPDLWRDVKAVEHSGEVTHREPADVSDEELINIATSGSARTPDKKGGKKEPNSVH